MRTYVTEVSPPDPWINLHTDDYTSLPLRPGDLLVSGWAEDMLISLSPWSDVWDSELYLFLFFCFLTGKLVRVYFTGDIQGGKRLEGCNGHIILSYVSCSVLASLEHPTLARDCANFS